MATSKSDIQKIEEEVKTEAQEIVAKVEAVIPVIIEEVKVIEPTVIKGMQIIHHYNFNELGKAVILKRFPHLEKLKDEWEAFLIEHRVVDADFFKK
jgi:hypothetical protein